MQEGQSTRTKSGQAGKTLQGAGPVAIRGIFFKGKYCMGTTSFFFRRLVAHLRAGRSDATGQCPFLIRMGQCRSETHRASRTVWRPVVGKRQQP